MSGGCANCYSTKWHPRRGSNRNDVDDQKSRPSKLPSRPSVSSPNHALGLWFVFVKGFYAQSPVRVALPFILVRVVLGSHTLGTVHEIADNDSGERDNNG